MTSLCENATLLEKGRNLTKSQKDALVSVSFYRNQIERGPVLVVGQKRFSKNTIHSLMRLELLRKSGKGYVPTIAGQVAIERLKGGGK